MLNAQESFPLSVRFKTKSTSVRADVFLVTGVTHGGDKCVLSKQDSVIFASVQRPFHRSRFVHRGDC